MVVINLSFVIVFEYFLEGSLVDMFMIFKVQFFKELEYIYIFWDYNIDIGKDFMGFCEIIERWIKDGKKVLVYCQQGVSRFVSLIIVYGLY